MGFLLHLKRAKMPSTERWFLKYDQDGLIKEVKQVYKASEYKKLKKARPLLTQKKLIQALEEDKLKRINNIII
tara:strand:+ start:4161 stop:4379 length:219 start_codon:yes stop_codon:yes gene_type:complete